jgi:hypothetical protein
VVVVVLLVGVTVVDVVVVPALVVVTESTSGPLVAADVSAADAFRKSWLANAASRLAMDGVTVVPGPVGSVAENVVMGLLEPAADTATTTAVVVASPRCSAWAAFINCIRSALTWPWRTSCTPLTNWASVGLVARIDW